MCVYVYVCGIFENNLRKKF